MNYVSASGIIIFILTLLTSAFVLIKNHRNIVNITWSLYSLFIAIWGIGLFFAFKSTSYESALFWSRFLNMIALFIPCLFLHFAYSFLGINLQHRFSILLGYFFVSSYFVFSLIYPNTFVTSVSPKSDFMFYPDAGRFYVLFPIYYTVLVSIGVHHLLMAYKSSTGTLRNQLNYLFWAMAIGFSGGATTFPLLFNIPVFPFGLPGVIILVMLVAYAILKHNLMDINVFIRRSTVYGLLFIVIMSSFVYAHLNSGNIWVFIGQTTLAIVICSIALYKYSQYEIERDRKSAKIMQSEYERQLEYRTILDGVRNAVFGQAHDLKNPLNVITTFTSDVRNMLQTNKNVDKVDKYLEMIQKNCSLMQEEIARLMDRINTNFLNRQIDFETDFKQENPLIDCVNEAKLKMEDSLLREQVNVSINVDPRIKVQYLSREMLVSIIVNLFSNALRAVEGVRSSQINIKTLPDDDYHFYFLFSDNGKGIPEDKLDKLFNEGFSLSDSTGYGLYNIKRAIENELVNGCISAKCDQGETTFTLRLKKTKL